MLFALYSGNIELSIENRCLGFVYTRFLISAIFQIGYLDFQRGVLYKKWSHIEHDRGVILWLIAFQILRQSGSVTAVADVIFKTTLLYLMFGLCYGWVFYTAWFTVCIIIITVCYEASHYIPWK